jgi:hypothetical protein
LQRVPFLTAIGKFDVPKKKNNTNYFTAVFRDLNKSGQENGGENYLANISVIYAVYLKWRE